VHNGKGKKLKDCSIAKMPKNTSVQGQKKKRFPTNKRIKTAIQEIELKNQTVRAIS
jgi:hypothetical protein